MQSLHEVQRAFHDAMLTGDYAGIASSIAGIAATARLDIYRWNNLSNRTDALRAVYPVVERLVGTHFFEAAVRVYVTRFPSISGDIHDYGDRFGEFLASFEPAAALGYLADVARLEWIWHEVFHAADQPPMDIDALARNPTERLGALRLDPSVRGRLFRSAWPVHLIWSANQPEQIEVATLQLDLTGADLLVRRTTSGYSIEIVTLSPAEFDFLDALSRGWTLADACESALEQDAAFDLGAVLRRHFESGTFAAPGDVMKT